MSWWNVAGDVSQAQQTAVSQESENLRNKIMRWRSERERLERLWWDSGTKDDNEVMQSIQRADRKVRSLQRSLEELEGGKGSDSQPKCQDRNSWSTQRTSSTSGTSTTSGYAIAGTSSLSPTPSHTSATCSSRICYSDREVLSPQESAQASKGSVSMGVILSSACEAFKSYERDVAVRHDAALVQLDLDAERRTKEEWAGLQHQVEQRLEEAAKRRDEAREACDATRPQHEIIFCSEQHQQQRQQQHDDKKQQKVLEEQRLTRVEQAAQNLLSSSAGYSCLLPPPSSLLPPTAAPSQHEKAQHQLIATELKEQRQCLTQIETWQAELDLHQRAESKKHMEERQWAHEESTKNRLLKMEFQEQQMRLAQIEEWQSELSACSEARAPGRIREDLNRRYAEVLKALGACTENEYSQREILQRELCVLSKELQLWRGIEEAEIERQCLLREQWTLQTQGD